MRGAGKEQRSIGLGMTVGVNDHLRRCINFTHLKGHKRSAIGWLGKVHGNWWSPACSPATSASGRPRRLLGCLSTTTQLPAAEWISSILGIAMAEIILDVREHFGSDALVDIRSAEAPGLGLLP